MVDIYLNKGGTIAGATSPHDVLRALAQTEARRVTSGVTALTNNSGGTEGTAIVAHDAVTNAAASGSNLAQKASTETALGTVLDGLAEIIAKANATGTALGYADFNVTDSSGATAADGTLGAVTVSVTGATTGVQAADLTDTLDDLDNMQYHAAKQVNKLLAAVGLDEVTVPYVKTTASTIAAITVSGGTAADPGVTKAAVDAILVDYRNNIKTLAEKLIDVNTAGKPLVIAN